jgi:hypothetical protein
VVCWVIKDALFARCRGAPDDGFAIEFVANVFGVVTKKVFDGEFGFGHAEPVMIVKLI